MRALCISLTSTDYDPHGPAGPTAFWKTADRTFDKMDIHGGDSETDEDNDEWE